MRALIRMHLGLAILMAICIGRNAPSLAGDSPGSATKAYCPFDEPRPKIPQEIIDDKRLDVKVKVFVKSKNLRDLFKELSAKTGVKITAARELHGERPIIYFHKRPLRDVMTEISGLYGYHWLISGKPGAYEYELFEDIRHAQRREEVTRQRTSDLNRFFMQFTEKMARDPAVLDQLLQKTQDASSTTWPRSYKGVPTVVSSLGTERLQDWLSAGSGSVECAALPPDLGNAIVVWQNASNEHRRQRREKEGLDPGKVAGYTVADLQSSTLRFAAFDGEGTDLPRLFMSLRHRDALGAFSSWPPSELGEDEIRDALNEPARQAARLGKPLPGKIQITANKPRWTDFDDSYILIGDVLEVIAGRTGLDVIADYYLQDYNTIDPFEKRNVKSVVDTLWSDSRYLCRFNGSLLTFRYYDWYSAHPATEPAAALVDKCWKEIEAKGCLDIETMVEIACLPDEQLEWDGFDFMPCADWAYISSDGLRLWSVLGPRMISVAKSDAGLPVSDLTVAQLDKLRVWIKSAGEDVKPDDLGLGTLRISYVEHPNDDAWKKYYDLELEIPDREPVGDLIRMDSMFDDKRLKQIIAQRKADAEADVIELVE